MAQRVLQTLLIIQALAMSAVALRHTKGDMLPTHGTWKLYSDPTKMPGTKVKDIGAEDYELASASGDQLTICSPSQKGVAGHYVHNVRDPTLELFLVDEKDPRRTDAAVVVAPGGGNMHLAWEVTGSSVAEWLNSLGISAFVVKYRVPTSAWKEGTKVLLYDAQRALSLVRSSAAKLGLNASRIGIFGASAGGGLAGQVSVATERDYPRVDEVDDLSPRPDFALLLYPAVSSAEVAKAKTAPETFIAGSKDDPCVQYRNVTAYYDALVQAGNSHSEIHYTDSGGHGYGNCAMYPEWKKTHEEPCGWTVHAEKFLNKRVLGRA